MSNNKYEPVSDHKQLVKGLRDLRKEPQGLKFWAIKGPTRNKRNHVGFYIGHDGDIKYQNEKRKFTPEAPVKGMVLFSPKYPRKRLLLMCAAHVGTAKDVAKACLKQCGLRYEVIALAKGQPEPAGPPQFDRRGGADMDEGGVGLPKVDAELLGPDDESELLQAEAAIRNQAPVSVVSIEAVKKDFEDLLPDVKRFNTQDAQLASKVEDARKVLEVCMKAGNYPEAQQKLAELREMFLFADHIAIKAGLKEMLPVMAQFNDPKNAVHQKLGTARREIKFYMNQQDYAGAREKLGQLRELVAAANLDAIKSGLQELRPSMEQFSNPEVKRQAGTIRSELQDHLARKDYDGAKWKLGQLQSLVVKPDLQQIKLGLEELSPVMEQFSKSGSPVKQKVEAARGELQTYLKRREFPEAKQKLDELREMVANAALADVKNRLSVLTPALRAVSKTDSKLGQETKRDQDELNRLLQQQKYHDASVKLRKLEEALERMPDEFKQPSQKQPSQTEVPVPSGPEGKEEIEVARRPEAKKVTSVASRPQEFETTKAWKDRIPLDTYRTAKEIGRGNFGITSLLTSNHPDAPAVVFKKPADTTKSGKVRTPEEKAKTLAEMKQEARS